MAPPSLVVKPLSRDRIEEGGSLAQGTNSLKLLLLLLLLLAAVVGG